MLSLLELTKFLVRLVRKDSPYATQSMRLDTWRTLAFNSVGQRGIFVPNGDSLNGWKPW